MLNIISIHDELMKYIIFAQMYEFVYYTALLHLILLALDCCLIPIAIPLFPSISFPGIFVAPRWVDVRHESCFLSHRHHCRHTFLLPFAQPCYSLREHASIRPQKLT